MRSVLLLAVIAATVACPPAARATNQSLDRVRFEGVDRWMTECPLGELLWSLPKEPEFDVHITSNWKGYVAAWEVKDGGLYLVCFEATQDKKPVPIDAILPGRKLPVLADWFTGRVRIIAGKVVERGSSVYGSVYERVVVLHIKKGKVIKTEEFKNLSITDRCAKRFNVLSVRA